MRECQLGGSHLGRAGGAESEHAKGSSPFCRHPYWKRGGVNVSGPKAAATLAQAQVS